VNNSQVSAVGAEPRELQDEVAQLFEEMREACMVCVEPGTLSAAAQEARRVFLRLYTRSSEARPSRIAAGWWRGHNLGLNSERSRFASAVRSNIEMRLKDPSLTGQACSRGNGFCVFIGVWRISRTAPGCLHSGWRGCAYPRSLPYSESVRPRRRISARAIVRLRK